MPHPPEALYVNGFSFRKGEYLFFALMQKKQKIKSGNNFLENCGVMQQPPQQLVAVTPQTSCGAIGSC
jgi:hypothetical protein